MRSSVLFCLGLGIVAACGPKPGGGNTDTDTGTGHASSDSDASGEPGDSDTTGANPGTTTGDSTTTIGGMTGVPVTTEADTGLDGEPCVLAEKRRDILEQCPTVRYSCGGCEGNEPVLDSEAALECTLVVLRDRIPGVVSWHDSSWSGQYGDNGIIVSLGDGTAVLVRLRAADLCGYTGPDDHVVLKEPTYFAGCMAVADPVERFECMKDIVESTVVECAPEVEQCGF